MKLDIRRFAVAAAAAMFLFGAVQARADEPFSITLPTGFGAFATQTQSVDAPDGKIETTNWITKSPSGEAIVITVSKMPAKILSPDKLIASTRDALIKSVGGTLESNEPVAGTMTGEQLKFKASGAWLSSRVLVDDQTLYQVLYVGRSEEQRALPVVADMFDSFQVKAPIVASAAAAPADVQATADVH